MENNKKAYNANKTFFQIGKEALEDALDALKNNVPLTVRHVELPDPPPGVASEEIIRMRTRTFRMSQHVFASMLNVAPKTLQSWEQGRNVPTGAALKLLQVAKKHPNVLFEQLGPIAVPAAKGKSNKARIAAFSGKTAARKVSR